MLMQVRQSPYDHWPVTPSYGLHRIAYDCTPHADRQRSREADSMTVCIAAVADNGASAVLCSDQLVSQTALHWGIESESQSKIHYITETSAILVAGNADAGDAIVYLLRAWTSDSKGHAFPELVRLAYFNVRKARVEHVHLGSRGLTYQDYLDRNATLQPLLIALIDRDMTSFDLGVDLIAAELQPNGQCSISAIWNPGLQNTVGAGFHCIGAGGMLATHAMLEHGYNTSLPLAEVEKIVRSAKQHSEMVPLVGKATTVRYLPRRG